MSWKYWFLVFVQTIIKHFESTVCPYGGGGGGGVLMSYN